MPVARSVESLKTLLAQINALAPNRSKKSDGWIGDVKHMSRHSDHNPEPDGTVDARDFTNDPNGGMDSQKLADAATASTSGRMAARIIPSGTTITIDVTCTGGNAGRCQIAVCTLKQYRLASAFDTFAEGLSDAVTTHVGSVDIPGNGIGIYMAMRNSSTTSSWSGASELLSQNVPAEAQRTSLAASYSPGVPRDATVTWGNTGHRVMLAASWR